MVHGLGRRWKSRSGTHFSPPVTGMPPGTPGWYGPISRPPLGALISAFGAPVEQGGDELDELVL